MIHFNTKEQPAFNRQFDLLIKDLKKWEDKGFQLIPVCRKSQTTGKATDNF